jgi:hypothetical protein
MVTKKCQKNAEKYICEKCNFECSKKSNFDKHILTAKHKMIINDNEKQATLKHVCKYCKKEYKHASGLSRHVKTCKYKEQEPIKENTEQKEIKEVEIVVKDDNKEIANKDLVIELIKQNQELQGHNQQLQGKLLEVAKEGKTINNHQTNNFNLNVFLNEDCKNALNLIDFINSLKPSINDVESMGRLGYVDGLSSIFVKALRNMDVTERPIHCTDIKRETVYVKDKDKWELETTNKSKLKETLNRIEEKNLEMLPAWQEENPNFANMNTRENDEYINISLNSLGSENANEKQKQTNKIIKNVLKEVTVDKNKINDK